MDSACGRFPQRGDIARIPAQHGLPGLGPRPHRRCNNQLAPVIHEMRTWRTPPDGTVKSSCPTLIEPTTKASSDRRPEAIEPSPASDSQPGQWATRRPSRPR